MAKIIDKLNFNNEEYQIKDATAVVSESSEMIVNGGTFYSLVRNDDGSFALKKVTYTAPAWNSVSLKIGNYTTGNYEFDTEIKGTITSVATTNGQPVSGTPTISYKIGSGAATNLTVTGNAPSFTGTNTLSTKLANGSSITATVSSLSGTIKHPQSGKVGTTGTKTSSPIAINQYGYGWFAGDENVNITSKTTGGFGFGGVTINKIGVSATKPTKINEEYPVNGKYLYLVFPSIWNLTESNFYIGTDKTSANAALLSGGFVKHTTVKTYSTSISYDVWRCTNTYTTNCGVKVQ